MFLSVSPSLFRLLPRGIAFRVLMASPIELFNFSHSGMCAVVLRQNAGVSLV